MTFTLKSGIDLIRIARLREITPAIRSRFLARVYTKRELEESGDNFEMLAGKFAAKEAVAKALGSGIGQVHWQDIEILHNANGQPVLNLGENARNYAERFNISGWSISISHESDYAVAMAVCFAAESD